MPERSRPDLDEKFKLPMEPDEALQRVLDGEGAESVFDEPEDEEPESP
jgi:hypothetical protein